jgi:hypothetical protein
VKRPPLTRRARRWAKGLTAAALLGSGVGAGIAACNGLVAVPTGIATDCSTTVTSRLNSFVANLPSETTVARVRASPGPWGVAL